MSDLIERLTKYLINLPRNHPAYPLISDAIEELDKYRSALKEIAESKYISYENTEYSQYGIGVTDGHRFCAEIAKKALAIPSIPEGTDSEETNDGQ